MNKSNLKKKEPEEVESKLLIFQQEKENIQKKLEKRIFPRGEIAPRITGKPDKTLAD